MKRDGEIRPSRPDQPHAALELPDFLCHIVHAFGFHQDDGKPSEPRDVFRPVFGADTTPGFIPVPVEDVVTTIFDIPMALIGLKDLLGMRLGRGAACDAISHIS